MTHIKKSVQLVVPFEISQKNPGEPAEILKETIIDRSRRIAEADLGLLQHPLKIQMLLDAQQTISTM